MDNAIFENIIFFAIWQTIIHKDALLGGVRAGADAPGSVLVFNQEILKKRYFKNILRSFLALPPPRGNPPNTNVMRGRHT